jgi:integrase/recombinase XerD
MIETISPWPSVRLRHERAPLLKERELYLTHLLHQGYSRLSVRNTAAYLFHVVREMNMNSMRLVPKREIEAAGQSWAAYEGPLRKKVSPRGSPRVFVQVARKWLRFHGQLETPPPNRFHRVIAEFIDAMRFANGLAPDTVRGYSSRAFNFLKWFGERHDSLEAVSLLDVDEFLASKRQEGWSVRSIASQCQALRSFFRYAEIRGWCAPRLALGIRSPRIPKYDGRPKAPTWAEVRRLLDSASGSSPSDLRAKAILLLFAIYGLRSSEVAGLQLSDFDWRNETFSVRRAKRGGVLQYPIQYEVGDHSVSPERPEALFKPSRFSVQVSTARTDWPWPNVADRQQENAEVGNQVGTCGPSLAPTCVCHSPPPERCVSSANRRFPRSPQHQVNRHLCEV